MQKKSDKGNNVLKISKKRTLRSKEISESNKTLKEEIVEFCLLKSDNVMSNIYE